MNDSATAPYSSHEESFLSDGTTCAARVYRPDATKPTPVIVMAHGFGAVRALRLYDYAERFAAAGYAVVVFDYRGFGDSAGQPRQIVDIGMQHADWRAALAFARSLDHVEPSGVIAWGTSFAGGHVLSLAGRGEQLAAVIAQVPHVSGPASVRATGLRASARIAPSAIRDQVRSLLGRSPVYVPLVGTPGQKGIMTTPDALPGLERLIVDSGVRADDYRQDGAARIGLKIGLYSPGRTAARISCPTLVQIAQDDAITPRAVAQKVAGRIPRSTVRQYECAHFDPYVEPAFSEVMADQLAFLDQHVPAR